MAVFHVNNNFCLEALIHDNEKKSRYKFKVKSFAVL